jgi:C-terminal processing protease CtpA/Prc
LTAGVEPQRELMAARDTLRRAIALAEEPCDRSGLWLDEPKNPDCSLVVSDLLYASGLMAYAKPNSLSSGQATQVLFNPSQFVYREGVNRLPLYVLVDGRTASASELFAGMLQDNKAATLLGTPTLGSGCGHTNGGIWSTLKNSGGRVSLPDCARFRTSGANEIVGITPDVLIPWRGFDSRYQRATKVLKALEENVRVK